MKKKLILVAAPPACGKNYVSELIGKALGNVAYLDKDELGGLVRRSFALCGEDLNMDGTFYLENLRQEEYATLLRLAFSALRFSDVVLVNAPFLREVRDTEYMRELKRTAALQGAELILVWVTAPSAVCYERMKQRGSDRDTGKLAAWEEYVASIDYSAPEALLEEGAVGRLFVFDNGSDESAAAALQDFLKTVGG